MRDKNLKTLEGVDGLSDVGDIGDVGEVGEVDMFGLDEFGQPAGMNPMWGAVIGGGFGTGAAILSRTMTGGDSFFNKHSELVGLVAGAAAGGVMMAFPGSRAAGWSALATALVTNGLREIEAVFMGGGATGSWGAYAIEPTHVVSGLGQDTDVTWDGLGAYAIEKGYPVTGLAGNGSYGHLGQSRAELVGPPTLVGAGDYGLGANPGVAQTQLLGGPVVSGLGAHFGSTVFGSH